MYGGPAAPHSGLASQGQPAAGSPQHHYSGQAEYPSQNHSYSAYPVVHPSDARPSVLDQASGCPSVNATGGRPPTGALPPIQKAWQAHIKEDPACEGRINGYNQQYQDPVPPRPCSTEPMQYAYTDDRCSPQQHQYQTWAGEDESRMHDNSGARRQPGSRQQATRRHRKRWNDGYGDEAAGPASGGSAGTHGMHYATQAANASGSVIRMRRSDAWGRFLAYEGASQVCLREMPNGDNVNTALHFLDRGCAELRSAFAIENLLLRGMTVDNMPVDYGQGVQPETGPDIIWDDMDYADNKLKAATFMTAMSLLKVRLHKLDAPTPGFWQKLKGRKNGADGMVVHLKVSGAPSAASSRDPDRYRLQERYVVGSGGHAMPGTPPISIHPDQQYYDLQLNVDNGEGVVASGTISCRRLWQLGLSMMALGGGPASDDDDTRSTVSEPLPGERAAMCCTKRGSEAHNMAPGASSMDVTLTFEGGKIGRATLEVQRVTCEVPADERSPTPGDDDASNKGHLRINANKAYDYVLDAALLVNRCGERNLEVQGPWQWLLSQFALLYGVRVNYQLLAHLRWVLTPGIASATAPCFDLVAREIEPLLRQEAAGGLTAQEAILLNRAKNDTEELLKLAFENYYALNHDAPKGISQGMPAVVWDQGAVEFPPEALKSALGLYHCMRDVFHPSDMEWLNDRFRTAAKRRWQRLASMCDDIGPQAEPSQQTLGQMDAPLRQRHLSMKAGSGAGSQQQKQLYAYKKLETITGAICEDLEYDLALQNEPGLLPSTLNVARITAMEYCRNFVTKLRGVLTQHPPHQPSDSAVDLLVSVARLQRYLDEKELAMPKGHPAAIDAMELFGKFVLTWISHSQEALCGTCRQLEASTELGAALHAAFTPAVGMDGNPQMASSDAAGVAPIVQEMTRHINVELHRYERVIKHWPVFGSYLEAAMCVALRAVVGAVSRQCGMVARARNGEQQQQMMERRSPGSPQPQHRRSSSTMNDPTGRPRSNTRHTRSPSAVPQWTWQNVGSTKSQSGGIPRVNIMVREAVLLNSLKRLMVMVPQLECTISKWCGGSAMPPPGPPNPPAHPPQPGYEDVAPHIGAQFAMVVKELRTQYSDAVASCAERLSSALSSNPATSLKSTLTQAHNATRQTPMPGQQQSIIDSMLAPLMAALRESMNNLKVALDPRVFVAVARGLWDFKGKQLFEFVEQLQEGKETKGAWRARQTAAMVLNQLNTFFKSALLSHMERGGHLQDRDLEAPSHIDRASKLLSQNTTALNMSYTPF